MNIRNRTICLFLGSAASTALLAAQTASPITHVVIIFQENRTPDNLFQDPVLIANGADIAGSGVNSAGQTIPLSQIDLGLVGANPSQYDLGHAHIGFLKMCNLNKSTGVCAMNGADRITVTCNTGVTGCPPANAQFKYVSPSDVQPYFQMAELYTFADRMFQTNQGPSFPAHQFILSGTSAPAVGSDLFVADNPTGIYKAGLTTGCIAPPGEYVKEIDPAGVETSTTLPCFEHATLTDLLDDAGLSWRYYTPSAGLLFTAPNAIQHMCVPNAAPPNATACVGPDWTGAAPKVVLKQSQILKDIAHNQLPAVSWVIPDGKASDHAATNGGEGPSWVASIVNAVGKSPYWGNTAILIAWDDWGGWYDHVPPQIINSYEYGFRVPLIVVSPYAKPGYISHVTHDFGSILRFIESNYNLPSLGYADAAADDLSDCFDFSQTPIPFQTIAAPLKADFFLNDKRPPVDPDDE